MRKVPVPIVAGAEAVLTVARVPLQAFDYEGKSAAVSS